MQSEDDKKEKKNIALNENCGEAGEQSFTLPNIAFESTIEISTRSDKSITKDNNTFEKTIDDISSKIRLYQDTYYNGNPQVSDDEFDALWDRLRALDINNPLFSKIGSDGSSFFVKTTHLMPMGSLDKVSDEDTSNEWLVLHPSKEYIVQHKLDGASLELQYERGRLVAAVTRGDGKKGDNIIINARKMQGVLTNISVTGSIAIRGEVVMTHDVHKSHFSDKANCRNAANGLMKRKDGKNTELLNVLCYDIWFVDDDHEYSELKKLSYLKELGFKVVPYEVLHNAEDIHSYRNFINERRKDLGYDIDGLVIKLPLAEKSDMESLRPDRQIAYKFPLEYAQSKIIEIEWSESGHLYTPVGILEPVKIAGTIVRRANLVHINHIRDLGLSVGAEVLVVKRGEIIPKIEKVVVPALSTDIDVPNICSTCGSKVVDLGTRLYCPNLECRRRLLFRVMRWCEFLEIEFWGEAIIYRLVMKENIINAVSDLYQIKKEQLVALDRMGDDLASKLLRELHSKKNTSLEIFLAAMGIDGVALLTAEKIVHAGYYNLHTLLEADAVTLAEVEGIGPIIARNICNFFDMFKDEIIELSTFISLKEYDIDVMSTLPLRGVSFCFTGALSMPRKEVQLKVKELGGQNKQSVTKDLTFLVCDNPLATTEKIKNAKKLGVQVISEKEFFDMLHS